MKKFKLTKKYILIGVAILALAGIVYSRTRANKTEYQEYTVESSTIRDTLDLSGEVNAAQSATLRFGAGGLITYMGAKEGDTVKKWQTLASVDTRQIQKVMEQRLNLYAIQRGTFDQVVDDNDNAVPDGDMARTLKRILEKNQFQLDNAVKDVEYQDLALKLSRVYSPISGILVSSPITVPNVQVAPTDTWIVVDPDTLQFVADLDETELSRVTVGQKVFITLDAFPDDTFESVVSRVSYSPKETTTGTTYEVTINLPTSAVTKLRLGLNGTASVLMAEKTGVPTLPSAAVTYTGTTASVTVKENDEYVTKEISTGIENEGKVEIISGLGVGDHVYQEK